MSEYMAVTIEIGGTLPASLIGELLQTITDDLSEINGSTTEKELRKEAKRKKAVKWYGQSNYGECDGIKAFCEEHKLSYIHTCEASSEYDGTIAYCTPDMKEEVSGYATQSGDLTVESDQIRPLVTLLLEYAKKGDDALPLFMTNDHEGVKNAVEKGLRKPKDFLPALEKEIQKALPIVPELSPFIIKE